MGDVFLKLAKYNVGLWNIHCASGQGTEHQCQSVLSGIGGEILIKIAKKKQGLDDYQFQCYFFLKKRRDMYGHKPDV